MNLVLLSGGSGKRLWPLSNDSRSKQFLRILEDQKSNYVSMVQRVYKQLEAVNLHRSTVIATSKSQVEMIHSQLGQVPVVIEPERRDTFPAIALAAVYLYSENKVDKDEVVAVLPVDPFVDNSFFEKVSFLEKVVQDSKSDLSLMGVTPTYPSSKYGYIIPKSIKNDNHQFLKVSHFKEKPTEEEAADLIEQKALWNCGVFAFKLHFVLDIVKSLGFPLDYTELLAKYNLLPKNSFDYEVVEKANNITVLPYDGYWKDLGTWNTLTEEMGSSILGKGKISEDSNNSHLINELDIPIVMLGVSDLLVAASPDGILVTEKSASPRLKEMILEFDQRPMYEERRWGWYKVLDYTKLDSETEILTKRIGINKGKNLSYQLHDKRCEVWTVVKGEGDLLLDGKLKRVTVGDVVEVPVGSKHAILALSDMEIIEVQRGSELIEEDIIRLEYDWKTILDLYLEESVR